MKRPIPVAILVAALLIPAGALGQTPDRISILDNLGTYDRGESMFIFGTVANLVPDAFLVLQITNPQGGLCQIQQMTPLNNGVFLTEPITMSGNICGIPGEYTIQLFYGDYRKSSVFEVTDLEFRPPSQDAASTLVEQKIESISQNSDANLDPFASRLDTASIQELQEMYTELWSQFNDPDAIYDVKTVFRPAVTTALDSIDRLLNEEQIDAIMAEQLEDTVYSAIFYYQIGNTREAVILINDVFANLKNVDPIKAPVKKLTFEELEETVMNLMLKTDHILSSSIKEEIAFIFARGTAPLYVDDLNALLDMLTKSRYLDVVSRKDTSLYKLVKNDWFSLRESLVELSSIERLLKDKDKVDDLHEASLLLRQIDRVDRYISSDESENSALANILKPEWDKLSSKLSRASSPESIIESKTEIQNMKNVIEISSRITTSVNIAQTVGADTGYLGDWRSLLNDVEDATSLEEVLAIVSEFDKTIKDLREKRNPLVSLKFEYEQLQQKAELHADYENLVLINQALRAIEAAEKLENGEPGEKLDRLEVLLVWAGQVAPTIRANLEKTAQDDSQSKARNILERAKSIENLIELATIKNRFLPGFGEFADSMNIRLDQARNLVINGDLIAATNLVDELSAEWKTVSQAYTDDPRGSPVGYSLDEIQRIEYREKLEQYSNLVATFYNSDFDAHSHEYYDMVNDAYDLIDHGNFIDAEFTIGEIAKFISEHLPLTSSKIIFNLSYNQSRDVWVVSGAVDKPTMDRREPIRITIYDTDGKEQNSLEFTDSRYGEIFTQWIAPTEPGIYIAMLQYQNNNASQIIHIEDEKREPRFSELSSAELSREFQDLQKFMQRFGGGEHTNARFASVISEIKTGLAQRDDYTVEQKLLVLERLIERYLPIRHPSAVIDATYAGSSLTLSGAVEKTLAFSEDLYIDIFDRQGTLVQPIALKDQTDGSFRNVSQIHLSPGIYVAQLQYHDLIVNDFFTVS